MRWIGAAASLALAWLVGACSTLEHTAAVQFDRQANWAILPAVNLSDTPQAGLRLENLLENQLRAKGVDNLQRYPVDLGPDLMLDPSDARVREQALQWVGSKGVRYAVAGTVNEWRYKTGVDGEPAVGVTLQVIALPEGRVIYSASGARSGWSREALAAVAQKLTRDMLDRAGL
jgi:hypothetical protein